jgi:uncharacterized HhH-GPD family protein
MLLMTARKADAALPWTEDRAATELLARDPMALLIGFLLDQQVPMEWAFGAPETLRQRLGGRLDAAKIAAMEPTTLVEVFLVRPPLHRYPASMAKRTQSLARQVVEDYGGDAARIWTTAVDATEVSRRIAKLPGFSATKARVIIGTLAKRLAVEMPGWEKYSPDWFSMADVDSKAALVRYREIKRAGKAAGSWPPGTKAKAKPAARKSSGRRPQPGKQAAKRPQAEKSPKPSPAKRPATRP